MDYNPRHAQTYFLQSFRALLTIMTQFDNPYAPSSTTAPMNYDERSELADRSTRFVGSLIDGLIMLPIVMPIAFGVGAIIGTVMGEGAATSIIANLVGGGIGIGVFVAIHGYLLATRGQTIGKVVMKTKIVTEAGEQLPFAELYLKRYLILQAVSLIPLIGLFVGIIDAIFIFRSNRKCLHDDIAGTKVIKIKA